MKIFIEYWLTALLGTNALLSAQSFESPRCEKGVEEKWKPFPGKVIGFGQSKLNNAFVRINRIYHTDTLESCLKECCTSLYGECNIFGFSAKEINSNCYHWFCSPLSLCLFVKAEDTDSYVLITNENRILNNKNIEDSSKHAPDHKLMGLNTYAPKLSKEKAESTQFYREAVSSVSNVPNHQGEVSVVHVKNGESSQSANDSVERLNDVIKSNSISNVSLTTNSLLDRIISNMVVQKPVPFLTFGSGSKKNMSLVTDTNVRQDLKHEEFAAETFPETRNSSSVLFRNLSFSSVDKYNISTNNITTEQINENFNIKVVTTSRFRNNEPTEVTGNKQTVITSRSDILNSSLAPLNEMKDSDISNNFQSHKQNISFTHNSFIMINFSHLSMPTFPPRITNKTLKTNAYVTLVSSLNFSDRQLKTVNTVYYTNAPARFSERFYINKTNTINITKTLTSNDTLMNDENYLNLYVSSVQIVIILGMGLIMLLTAFGIIGKRVQETWQRRHYSKMNFLTEGMYYS
ncbi:uncharacterized protein LOC143232610 [Tachypleus tridentatus]|uniref:uncharacterized protein LOC143232610 n=1 Tax=Tachypleus tridentatus TaxID=6853 RepID=UPI003FD3CDCE